LLATKTSAVHLTSKSSKVTFNGAPFIKPADDHSSGLISLQPLLSIKVMNDLVEVSRERGWSKKGSQIIKAKIKTA
jgi:hypothetical protein